MPKKAKVTLFSFVLSKLELVLMRCHAQTLRLHRGPDMRAGVELVQLEMDDQTPFSNQSK